MPVHPAIASKFPLLESIRSMQEAWGDPAQRAVVDEVMLVAGAPAPPDVPTRDDAAPGPHGPVPVRVYAPSADGSDRPCLVWMHGGAFMFGDLDMNEADWTARQICDRVGAVVVSVDYRLARGGVTYPVPLDDVVAAVRWARDDAATLGVDPARITVGGASAGATLAAGAALRLRDEDGWVPAALLLAYPAMHAPLPAASPALAADLTELPALFRSSPGSHDGTIVNYLGGPVTSADGYALPSRAVLEGLCPTLVLNAQYDELRSSGEAFAAACAVAGVDVSQVLVTGMLHGFLNGRADVEPVDRALDLMARTVAENSGAVHCVAASA